MKYRRFGSVNWEVSLLGLGIEQLPCDSRGRVDEPQSSEVIRTAIEQGVNYISLGQPYDAAQHECRLRAVRQALEGNYHQKVKIASTLPLGLVTSWRDLDRSLDEQLRWVGAEQFDFCLLGRITRDNWPKLRELEVLQWAERAMQAGRIAKLGFSFHDHYQILRTILNAYDGWSLCEFQYSYMDVDHDPGITGIKYAAEQGVAVVVTEPLRSGRLTRQLPPTIADLWSKMPKARSLAEWGLRFVWNHAEIATVVTNVRSREEAIEDAALATSIEPDELTVQELVVFGQARDGYRKLRPINCPSCRACMPCPIGIDVPRIFELYNDAIIFSDADTGRDLYSNEGHQADACTQCGICVSACAKSIPILDWLPPAHDLLRRNTSS